MRRIRHITIFSLAMIGAFLHRSCTKAIPLDYDEESIVVNSIMYNSIPVSGALSYSTLVTDSTATEYINEATIEFYENNVLIETLFCEKGIYGLSGFYPQAGNNYSVKIIAGNDILTAGTNIPGKAVIVSVDTITTLNDDNGPQLSYKLLLEDQEGDDFYRLAITRETVTQYYSGGEIKYERKTKDLKPDTDDKIFDSLLDNFGGKELDFGPDNEYRIFSDEDFKNQQITIGFNTPHFNDTTTNIVYEAYHIYIHKLSPEFFYYLKSIILYIYYNKIPFSEPVEIYSNVINGIGVFAGFNDEAVVSFQETFIPYKGEALKAGY